MVLESIFRAREVLNKPLDMLILSTLVSFVCIFISYAIFPQYAGVILPSFVTITMTPLMYRIFSLEEETEREEAEHKIQKSFIERHGDTVWLLTLFFIGNFIAIFIVAWFSSEEFVIGVFKQQLDAISAITSISGSAVVNSVLGAIINNNLRVMIFSFVLSFLLGTGAIFILSWNASILGVYFAGFLRGGQFQTFYQQTLGIIPHAPIEIFAYFLALIAGGILSVGIIREKINSKEFMLVLRDSLILLMISVFAVLLGGFVEVYL